ncbi:hypothetical protein [Xanthomonas sp. LMG 12461]|uniref:hypothetical protein n=1 Tax=Xanthomonas sp. LMG 12461 TaxID=2014543 RepID=UPI001265307F|nr:hypothetical protein [Xanthomonas sp. LMG 12461]KAB7768910.1 hypothetical protein CEK68_04800 [Xanthomonas sp. LMG 12461]
MAQQAYVLYCVQFDAQTHECTQQAWLPAPSLLPPLTVEQAGQIGSAALLFLGACWIWKKLGQQTQR